MSDLVRDFIKVWSPDKHRSELLEALDAERAEHAKEKADLIQVIHEVQKRDTHHTLILLDRERKAKDEEISDLQRHISELEAQLQDKKEEEDE